MTFAIMMFAPLIGYGLLAWVDWRIALGVFLIEWGMNIHNRIEYGN